MGMAAAALLWQALPKVPRDQPLLLKLGRNSRKVKTLNVSFQSESLRTTGGFELHFPQGAPPIISHSLRVLEGRYQFEIQAVKRTGERTALQRRVTLTGTTATLRLEPLI